MPRNEKLKNEPSFEHNAISEMLKDAGEEAIEDEKLPESVDFGAGDGSSDALLQRHPERFGRSILT